MMSMYDADHNFYYFDDMQIRLLNIIEYEHMYSQHTFTHTLTCIHKLEHTHM